MSPNHTNFLEYNFEHDLPTRIVVLNQLDDPKCKTANSPCRDAVWGGCGVVSYSCAPLGSVHNSNITAAIAQNHLFISGCCFWSRRSKKYFMREGIFGASPVTARHTQRPYRVGCAQTHTQSAEIAD